MAVPLRAGIEGARVATDTAFAGLFDTVTDGVAGQVGAWAEAAEGTIRRRLNAPPRRRRSSPAFRFTKPFLIAPKISTAAKEAGTVVWCGSRCGEACRQAKPLYGIATGVFGGYRGVAENHGTG